jgi:hypothetical protein
MVMVLAVVVGIAASDPAGGGFFMWTVWALLWLTITAFAAAHLARCADRRARPVVARVAPSSRP